MSTIRSNAAGLESMPSVNEQLYELLLLYLSLLFHQEQRAFALLRFYLINGITICSCSAHLYLLFFSYLRSTCYSFLAYNCWYSPTLFVKLYSFWIFAFSPSTSFNPGCSFPKYFLLASFTLGHSVSMCLTVSTLSLHIAQAGGGAWTSLFIR